MIKMRFRKTKKHKHKFDDTYTDLITTEFTECYIRLCADPDCNDFDVKLFESHSKGMTSLKGDDLAKHVTDTKEYLLEQKRRYEDDRTAFHKIRDDINLKPDDFCTHCGEKIKPSKRLWNCSWDCHTNQAIKKFLQNTTPIGTAMRDDAVIPHSSDKAEEPLCTSLLGSTDVNTDVRCTKRHELGSDRTRHRGIDAHGKLIHWISKESSSGKAVDSRCTSINVASYGKHVRCEKEKSHGVHDHSGTDQNGRLVSWSESVEKGVSNNPERCGDLKYIFQTDTEIECILPVGHDSTQHIGIDAYHNTIKWDVEKVKGEIMLPNEDRDEFKCFATRYQAIGHVNPKIHCRLTNGHTAKHVGRDGYGCHVEW
jgi:hypothetical protein